MRGFGTNISREIGTSFLFHALKIETMQYTRSIVTNLEKITRIDDNASKKYISDDAFVGDDILSFWRGHFGVRTYVDNGRGCIVWECAAHPH